MQISKLINIVQTCKALSKKQSNLQQNILDFSKKIEHIITRISEQLDITTKTFFELFYESETCRLLNRKQNYLFRDLFITDKVTRELQNKF